MANNTRHRWDMDDVCKNCGIRRKSKPFSKNMVGFAGKFFYDYFVNGKWQEGAPECEKKNKK